MMADAKCASGANLDMSLSQPKANLPFSLAAFIDAKPFQQIIKRFVCGTAVHAGRRIHEMADSLELLKSVGAPTRMTRATHAMFKELIEMQMPERYNGKEPDSIEPVLAALVEARAAR